MYRIHFTTLWDSYHSEMLISKWLIGNSRADWNLHILNHNVKNVVCLIHFTYFNQVSNYCNQNVFYWIVLIDLKYVELSVCGTRTIDCSDWTKDLDHVIIDEKPWCQFAYIFRILRIVSTIPSVAWNLKRRVCFSFISFEKTGWQINKCSN